MADTTTHGEGTTFEFGTVTLTAVTITGPTRAVGEVDITNLASTSKEYRPGLPDSGTIQIEAQYDPVTDKALEGYAAAPSLEDWTLTFSDGSTRTGEGFVTACDIGGIESEGTLTVSLTVRISGAITVTDAA